MIKIFLSDGSEHIWSIGESSPFNTLYKKRGKWEAVSRVDGIAVDGPELSLLQNIFEGLPFHRTEEPQFWTGEMAKFILVNILPFEEECSCLHALDDEGRELLKWSKDDKLIETDLDLVFETEFVKCHFNEISWLLANYKNLPYHKENPIQIWIGDMARFIVGQLPARDGQQ